MKRFWLLLMFFGVLHVSLSAQTAGNSDFAASAPRTVKGLVTDQSGEPLLGVSITVPGTRSGVVTNLQGEYSLTLPRDATTLEFSYIGMQSQRVALDNRTTINVSMQEDLLQINEVVVVGYGVQNRRDVTGAISSISSDEIQRSVAGDINTSLQGRIPGLSIVANSGEPGAGATINLRGAASMSGSSEPLYIIDGVPYETENINSIDEDATFSPMASINPADIESIEVLRDAASAAIYGSRAANGVVIITTKGGNQLKSLKTVVNVTHTSSVVSVARHLDVMSSEDFRQAYIEARHKNGQTATNAWVTNPTHPYYVNPTDWQDVLFRTAYQHKTDANLRGSTENFAYSLSLGYRDVQPVIVGTSYKQYSGRGNFTYKITNHIKAGTNVYYSAIDYERILSGSESGALHAAMFTNPCFTPYDPITGELVYRAGQDEAVNPLALALRSPIGFKRSLVTLAQYVDFTLAKGLVLKLSVAGDINQTVQSSYRPKEFDSGSDRKDTGAFSQDDGSKFLNENTLNYSVKLGGDHNITALLGQSLQANRNTLIELRGENYVDQLVTEIQYASKMTRVTRTISERRMLSFFGRLNYNYKSRYIVAATLRADGSSRFGSDKRIGYFPSASVGWRVSDEPFMQFAKPVVQDIKFRASYGVTGNQNIGNYAWQGTYASNAKRYNGVVAVTNDALQNPTLGWETTTQINLGMDASFFKGRLVLTADLYKKHSKDLLFNFTLPSYTGFGSYPTNYGAIENKGLELTLSAVPFTGAFTWTSDFNISFNRNKVVTLPEGIDIIVGSFSLAREGQPAGVFYALHTDGVFARSEDNMWYGPNGEARPVVKGSATGQPYRGGDMIWRDLDNNGIIDDKDRMIVGNPHPDFIGGFANTFSYKGISLNVFLQFSYGNEIMNRFRSQRNRMTSTRNLSTEALQRWQNEGDITTFPMVRYGDPMTNFDYSNYWVEDGSFLRLKNVSLSYNIPSKTCKALHMSRMMISATAVNLLTWSSYKGFDPEVNTSSNPFIFGVDTGTFPTSRSFNLGIDITF